MLSFFEKRKTKRISNLNEKVETSALIAQTVGVILMRLFVLAIYGILTVFVVFFAIKVDFWFMTLLALALVGGCVAMIAAIVIDICNIVSLARENSKKGE